jgi:hypothetical protein
MAPGLVCQGCNPANDTGHYKRNRQTKREQVRHVGFQHASCRREPVSWLRAVSLNARRQNRREVVGLGGVAF